LKQQSQLVYHEWLFMHHQLSFVDSWNKRRHRRRKKSTNWMQSLQRLVIR
jgi:hypothetical protein